LVWEFDMKAALIYEHGDPSVVQVAEVEAPVPGAGEVALKVLCAGLNHLDIWVRKGRAKMPMPHILGCDAVGIVTAVGANVESPRVGEQVIVNPALSCGRCESCRRGEQSLCASFGIIGLSRNGTFAEQAVVPASNCYPKPRHLTDEEAGALALSHTTAWRMLMTRAQIKPGESVLIHGIGGGVALSALQLAKRVGAEVFVTSSSNEKLSRAQELGADHTINYEEANVADWIRHHKGDRGVDVVIDAAGAATWPLDFTCVRKGGRVVLCGVTTGAKAETDLRTLYWNQLTILGSTLGSTRDVEQMLAAVNVNRLRPVIDEVYPLDRVRDAMAKMEEARQFGKIVLKVTE
jgi:NADPH:quinone reductase-like Zn-dependent oxidoreductase